MAERPLGGGRLGGRLNAYVPRGAQYDYQPPSVFARYRILTVVFAVLAVALFGYWTLVMRHRAAASPPPRAAASSNSVPVSAPGESPSRVPVPAPGASSSAVPPAESQPVYVEPLPPK